MKALQNRDQLHHIIRMILCKQAPEIIFLLSHIVARYDYDNLFFVVNHTIEQPAAYLLLLIIDTDAKTCTQIQSIIENHLQQIAPVTCWCMSLTTFNEQLKYGDHFAGNVFTKAERLYVAEDAAFETPVVIIPLRLQSEWYQRALEFYAGAELYMIRKQYALAAFHLHQCAEQAFTGIIYNTCGYRPSTHNLLLLYKYACWFEPSLHSLFPATANNEDNLLHLLQRAYKESRYTSEYSIKGKQLEAIKDKIQQLLQQARVLPGT